MTSKITILLGLLALAGGTQLFAQSAVFELILAPVAFDGVLPGAHGSRWVTELTGFNRSAESRRIVTFNPSCQCVIPEGCPPYDPRPGVFFVSTCGVGTASGGAFLLVEKQASDAFSFSLRVRDISRDPQNAGTEVPVVRQKDFFGPAGSIPILNIPLSSRHRRKLRVYDYEGALQRQVRVQFLAVYSSVIREHTLTLGESGPRPDGVFYWPGYAELDFDDLTPQGDDTAVHIRVLLPPTGKFWAFVTMIDNETQQITVIPPAR